MTRVLRTVPPVFGVIFVLTTLASPYRLHAQQPPPIALKSDGKTITFAARDAYEQITLRVSAPDGRTFEVSGSSGSVTFAPFTAAGPKPPEGSYTWEVRLTPRGAVPAEVLERAKKARETGETEASAALRVAVGRAVVVQSGGFRIEGGKLYAGQETEPAGGRPRRQARAINPRTHGIELASMSLSSPPSRSMLDFVIADDLIVQGSACIGLDCVDGEAFGFDTIRMKENNTRLKYDDTSSSVGFPANDWQLTANDSASGGLNKWSVDDVTGAKTPFTIEAGTPTNALYVDSTGKIGFRTATPVLDLQINTSDTPAIRQEQNSSGGFTAQTWDIGGNEANWFVRDVTGGSRLPLRIRPGAPTSSVDIAATGRVGVGTATPQSNLHVFSLNTADSFVGLGPNPGGVAADQSGLNIGYGGGSFGRGTGFLNVRPDTGAVAPNPSLRLLTANVERMIITNTGNIGIGISNPAAGNLIEAASGARLTVGGAWLDSSSRAVKDEIRPLAFGDARAAFAGLQPVTFVYRAAPGERHVGFIAEDVPDLVASGDRKALSPMDLVAVLTRVVQDQDRRLAAQEQQLAELAAKFEALAAARQK
jgi:hypothetical protein